jgi:4-hydroxy-4-methyl-2-oxoglutarate aldolase
LQLHKEQFEYYTTNFTLNCLVVIVAGSLFSEEAARRGVSGIVVDGPIRDVDDLNNDIRVYSTLVTPYAGTVQNPGDGIDVSPVLCGGVMVNPGDVVFGDADGVLVGSVETFQACLPEAENIMSVEQHLMEGMKLGVSLHSMTNFDEHIQLRKEGKESKLDFKDRNTIKFTGLDPVQYS